MIRYQEYHFDRKEKLICALMGSLMSGVLLYLFYESVIVVLIGIVPGVWLFSKYRKIILIEKRREVLTMQFKDAMESLVAALGAGYSMEHGIGEARRDLSYMYQDSDLIMRELSQMEKRIQLRVSVEELLTELGERSGVEEIQNFAEIFVTARRSGGHLLQIMKQTADNISEKIQIQRQIQTMITGKQLEMRCMTAIPLAIIMYLKVSTPGFLDPMYHNPMGALIMSMALILYGLSYLLANRIMKISY